MTVQTILYISLYRVLHENIDDFLYIYLALNKN